MSITQIQRTIVGFLSGKGTDTIKVGTLTEKDSGSGITISSDVIRTGQRRVINTGAKIGGTSGWLVNAADDKNSLARCPAGETASTLVVPIPDLKVGDTITGYSLNGQIESGGNTATLDASLRKQSALVASGLTDAAVSDSSLDQISVTEDTLILSSSDAVTGLSEEVGLNQSYYLLLTATTAASTDIDLLNVVVTITES